MEYPKATVPPKMHYLTHTCMAKQMQNFGPLRHQWCMRFKAKHAFVKNKNGNALSMANFHQKWLCGQMIVTNATLSENVLYQGDQIEEGETVLVTDLPDHQRAAIINKLSAINVIYVASQVKIHGCVYREGTVLINSFDFPHLFVQVVKIIIKDQEKHFLVQNLKIVDFLENSLCYKEDFDQLFQLVS